MDMVFMNPIQADGHMLRQLKFMPCTDIKCPNLDRKEQETNLYLAVKLYQLFKREVELLINTQSGILKLQTAVLHIQDNQVLLEDHFTVPKTAIYRVRLWP